MVLLNKILSRGDGVLVPIATLLLRWDAFTIPIISLNL